MRELPQVLVELRQLQSLYPLLAPRPALVADLEARGMLARAAPNDTRRVSPTAAIEIAEFLHHQGEHHVSARLAAAVDPSAGDGLQYFARSCASLREVLATLLQHQVDWLPGAHFQLQQPGRHVELRLLPHEPGAPLGLLLYWEGTLTWLHRMLQDCLGQPLGVLHASVMTPATPQSAVLQQLLGGPVQFEAAHFSLRWPAQSLDRPLPGSNPVVCARLSGCFEGITRSRQVSLPCWRQVLDRLEAAPTPEAMRMEAVAEHLGMTAITLRRRLATEGRQFNAIATAFQRERAFAMAVGEGLPEAALAERLGYAGRVSMARAFHGWFGAPAATLRATHQTLQTLGVGSNWASPLHLPPSPLPEADAHDEVIPSAYALGEASRACHGAPALNAIGLDDPEDAVHAVLDQERREHLAQARRWLHVLPAAAPDASDEADPPQRVRPRSAPVPDGATSRHLGGLLQRRMPASGVAEADAASGPDPQALGHLLLAAWRLPPACLHGLGPLVTGG